MVHFKVSALLPIPANVYFVERDSAAFRYIWLDFAYYLVISHWKFLRSCTVFWQVSCGQGRALTLPA